MEGEVILKHPNKSAIDEMFTNGHTAEEVQNYLRQIQKNKRWQTSKVTLQHYRKNFLNLTRLDVNKIRRELKESGNTRDENVLSTFVAGQEFVTAKNAQTQEIYNFINDFKNIKDEALSAITLIKQTNRDADGNLTFRSRDFEVMEKFLGRIESSANSYIKAMTEVNKTQSASSQTNITITTAEIEKYKEAFKTIIKRIALELDPDKINKFINIYSEEISKITGISTGNFQIQINSAGTSENNINIITTPASLPSEEQAEHILETLINENVLENVIDIPIEAQNKEQS